MQLHVNWKGLTDGVNNREKLNDKQYFSQMSVSSGS
jgi:hypothetical protein